MSLPSDATADTTSTGLSSANECWACNTGYDNSQSANFCSRVTRPCRDKKGGVEDGGIELLKTDASGTGDYEHCGPRPTVSIYGGKIPNLRAGNASAFALSGVCSVDGTDNVRLLVTDSSSSVSARGLGSCAGRAWEIDLDLSALVTDDPKVFTVKVTHEDAVGRESLSAQSSFNTVCPGNYVLVPSLAGYTMNPFCVAKYEMKFVLSGGGREGFAIVSSPRALIFSGVKRTGSNENVAITRNEAITRCTELGQGYDLMTNDEWQTVARNIEGVSSNWGGGTVGSAHRVKYRGCGFVFSAIL